MLCSHLWAETGRSDWTIATHNGHPKDRTLYSWLKCNGCGADGFRRGESAVAYCWEPCHMVIIE